MSRDAHLAKQDLARFLAGEAAPDDALRTKTHLDVCLECRRQLDAMSDDVSSGPTLASPMGGAPEPKPEFPFDEASAPTAAAPSGDAPFLSAPTSAPHSAANVLPVGTEVGRYVIVGKLGIGGMARVYVAYDPKLERKVALKLLRPETSNVLSAEQGQARLLREAHAMAKLSHPHVVEVHDVGTFKDQVFIAMELVEGLTLKQWLREQPRSWRDVLQVFRDAGAGLAAAHAVGLIHRDVKPDNLLVGRDGRTRVTDFGLARAAESLAKDESVPSTIVHSEDDLSEPLTQAGIVMGTPGYAAPEQLYGEPVDGRSDEFSLCVALYEALFGERPYPGKNFVAYEEGLNQPISPAKDDGRVPGWLKQVVLRGVRFDAKERYPTMSALLTALAANPWDIRRRRVLVGAALAICASAVGLAVKIQRSEGEACRSAERRFESIWSGDRKAAIRGAFEATGAPFAADAWAGVERRMDAYTQEWTRSRVQACELSRHSSASAELPLLQSACLERRFEEARALADVFAQADRSVVQSSIAAADSLTPLRECTRADALRLAAKLPDDPKVKIEIDKARLDLAHAKALQDAGRFAPGLAIAESVVTSARTLAYGPLLAEALAAAGWLQVRASHSEAAAQTLEEGELLAEANRQDPLAADVATRIIYAYYERDDYESGRRWVSRTQALIQRLGGDDALEGALWNSAAALSQAQGHREEALDLFERSLALRTRALGAENPDVASTMYNIAVVLEEMGQFEKAAEWNQKALDEHTKVWGPNHPMTIGKREFLGTLLNDAGDYEAALPLIRHALEQFEGQLDPNHYYIAEALRDLGESLRGLGKRKEALAAYQRARAIQEKAHGPTAPEVFQLFTAEGQVLLEEGKVADALQLGEKSVSMIEKGDPESPDLEPPLNLVGAANLRQGRTAQALAAYRRAIEIADKKVGPEAIRTSESLTGLGMVFLSRKTPAEAIAPLERALALRNGRKFPREYDGDTRFALAQALWDTKGERERARRLAREARDEYTQRSVRRQRELAQVNAWLALRERDRSRSDP